jgi:dihydroorotate dehydrogenase electron transfer subunit
MKKIVVENSTIVKRVNLGGNIIFFELAPFSRVRFMKPGQFVHIMIPHGNVFFRRAFSIYETDTRAGTFGILFKIFGRGTAALADLKKGDKLNVLGPLGSGFKMPSRREKIILAAGGIGMPPIYALAKRLIEKGYNKEYIFFFYGATSKADLIDTKRIKRLGVRLYLSTDDGSAGFRGLITEAIINELQDIKGRRRLYACGPEGMLKAIDKFAGELRIPGQLSLEAPMPCGIGVCLGCIRPLTSGGYTRVCREGPVYDFGEVAL